MKGEFMNEIFKFITTPIVFLFKTLDGVREYVEDRIADVLDRVQENESIDKVEKKLIKEGVEAGLIYFLGKCPVDSKKLEAIADSIVEKGINKINPAISKQLRK